MPNPENDEPSPTPQRLTRRQMLGLASAGAAGLALGGIGGSLVVPRLLAPPESEAGGPASTYPFFGAHQSGVTTPVQDHTALRVVRHGRRRESRPARRAPAGVVVRRLAHDAGPRRERDRCRGRGPRGAARRHGRGARPVGQRAHDHHRLRSDLFEKDGTDRFGIASQRPAELERLPPFVGRHAEDRVEPRRPVRPGLRRRSTGRRPRRAQPDPDRLRRAPPSAGRRWGSVGPRRPRSSSRPRAT